MVSNKYLEIQDIMPHIRSGMKIMVGGFGLIGSPLTLIEALCHHDVQDLTILSNNMGEQNKGLGKLLHQKKVKKVIGSYFTSNRDVVDYYNRGEIEAELIPQGTFAEAIRAGGAGIGGFYTKTAVGTSLARDKEIKVIDNEPYLFQKALKADVALIKAWKADKLGNIVYYKTAQNFNVDMATAAETVIVEADEIVEVGELPPHEIATPHLFTTYIVKSQLTLRKHEVTNP